MKEEILFAGFIPLLKQLRTIKRPLDAAPNFTPQNAHEQIQYYENGVTRRLYLYINASWRYVTLT